MHRTGQGLTMLSLLVFAGCTKPADQGAKSGASASAAVSAAPPTGPVLDLKFCSYTSEKPTEIFQQFAGMVAPIERGLTTRMKRPVKVELKIIQGYAQGIDELVAGRVDFCQVGPASYVTIKRRNPGVTLLAMESEQGKKHFDGMIVVKKDSPVQKMVDLKGRTFAFGDMNSTIGRYLGQQALMNAGLRARDLASYKYLGRHDLVGAAVKRGEFDAGALKGNSFEKENADGSLRIIQRVTTVTRPWAARAGLEADVVQALRETLLAIDDKAALDAVKISGFLAGDDKEYDETRAAVDAAEEFIRGFDGGAPEATEGRASPKKSK